MKFLKQNSLLKLTLAAVLILGLGLMAGCDDDDDPAAPGGGGSVTGGTMSATLDGTGIDFSTDSSGVKTGATNVYVLAGTSVNSQALLISVLGVPGTYSVNNTSDTSVNLTYNSAAWACVSGTVIVSTATDTRMSGSFIGTFEDLQNNTMTVTNGAFDVPVVVTN